MHRRGLFQSPTFSLTHPVFSSIFLQNAQLDVTGINVLVYADARMEPLAIALMVLARVSLDTSADTVKQV